MTCLDPSFRKMVFKVDLMEDRESQARFQGREKLLQVHSPYLKPSGLDVFWDSELLYFRKAN